jgi:hypothetical protein
MMMTGDTGVLVTGALGVVGRALVPVLRSAGHYVVATDLPDTASAAEVHADLADARQADALIGEGAFSAVVHAAAIPAPGNHPPHVVFGNNMMATFNVVEASVRSGVRRLVNISSVGVLGLHYAERRFLPDYLPIDEEHRLRQPASVSSVAPVVHPVTLRASRQGDYPPERLSASDWLCSSREQFAAAPGWLVSRCCNGLFGSCCNHEGRAVSGQPRPPARHRPRSRP